MQNELMFPTRNQYAWFMLKNKKKKKDQQSMHKSTTNSLLYSSKKKKKKISAFLWNWFSQLQKTVVLF